MPQSPGSDAHSDTRDIAVRTQQHVHDLVDSQLRREAEMDGELEGLKARLSSLETWRVEERARRETTRTGIVTVERVVLFILAVVQLAELLKGAIR